MLLSHRLNRLFKLLAVLSELLVLGQERHCLLLSSLTSLLSLHLGNLELLDLIVHAPHDLFLDLTNVATLSRHSRALRMLRLRWAGHWHVRSAQL